MAIVKEYRKEINKSRRNDFTKMDYPYVKLGYDSTLYCLRNASSSKRYYDIGEVVEVFWDDGILLAWEI